MAALIGKAVRALMLLVLVLVLLLAGFVVAAKMGWFSVIGIRSSSSDSQVVQAVKRTQEVSLLGLGIQGIKETDRCREVFGGCVPGSNETVFLQYDFTAKLGVDGADVAVDETGANSYRISVPEFIQIGFDDPNFKVATEDGGVLRFVTPDIDKLEMVNEILNADARAQYVEDHRALLEDQTKVFYDSLIKSVDPDAETTYEFSS